MPRVCHLWDPSAGWEQRTALTSLSDRMDAAKYPFFHVHLSPSADSPFRKAPTSTVVHPLGPWSVLAGPTLKRRLERDRPDLIHAWSVETASAARSSFDATVLLSLFDPAMATKWARRLRVLSEAPGFTIACGSAIVRRRLIESGVAPSSCVLIRPAVDFSVVNRARRGDLRERLNIGRERTMIVVPEPVTRESGAFEAYQAAAMVHQLRRDVAFVLPGRGDEVARIERFAQAPPGDSPLIRTDQAIPTEELICIADVLIAAAGKDVSTTPLAWAMAGGAAILGAAVPSIAELIAHKVNGLLFNPKAGCGPVVSMAKLLNESDVFPRIRETARGQAYEVFGARRNADQYVKLYENLLGGAPACDGITDSAAAS